MIVKETGNPDSTIDEDPAGDSKEEADIAKTSRNGETTVRGFEEDTSSSGKAPEVEIKPDGEKEAPVKSKGDHGVDTKEDPHGEPEGNAPTPLKEKSKEGAVVEKKGAKKEVTGGTTGKEGSQPGIRIPSRVDIVKQLISKHKRLLEEYKAELDVNKEPLTDLTDQRSSIKEDRDRENDEVQKFKIERSRLKEENKKLSSEFFDLIQKVDKLKEMGGDVSMYSKFCKDIEWKLETEAISLENERRLMSDLKNTLDKLRSLSDGLTPEEIDTKLDVTNSRIKSNLEEIENLHRQMQVHVEKANEHHDKYLELLKNGKDIEGRRGWLKRRIPLHEEMLSFWEGQLPNTRKMDEEEDKRMVEQIRDRLLQAMDKEGIHTSKDSRIAKEEKGGDKASQEAKDAEKPKNGKKSKKGSKTVKGVKQEDSKKKAKQGKKKNESPDDRGKKEDPPKKVKPGRKKKDASDGGEGAVSRPEESSEEPETVDGRKGSRSGSGVKKDIGEQGEVEG